MADDQMSMEQLLQRARGGDEKALAELLENYRPYLLMIANQDLESDIKPKIAASDVVQESMVTAHEAFGRFEGTCEAELRGWLRKILINDMHHTRRAFKGTQKRELGRERSLQYESSTDFGLVDPNLTPGTNALNLEKSELLQAAIAEMPEDYRTVLQLHSFERLSFEEVGQKMDRTAGAARKLWTRAVHRLQQVMAEKKIID